MYIKNSNFAIYLGVALLAGFGLSFAVGTHSSSDFVSGDISKAKNYFGAVEDPQESLFDEKLANDSEYYKMTQATMDLLQERMDVLADLTKRTESVCGGIEEFTPVLKSINSLHAKSYNTSIAVKAATEAMKKALDGKHTSFEKNSTDAYIGYMRITSQLAAGKQFVDIATSYVEGKDPSECEDICRLVGDWSIYCVLDAALNGQESEVSYWRAKSEELSGSEALAGMATGFGAVEGLKSEVAGMTDGQILNAVGSGQETLSILSNFDGQMKAELKGFFDNMSAGAFNALADGAFDSKFNALPDDAVKAGLQSVLSGVAFGELSINLIQGQTQVVMSNTTQNQGETGSWN